MLDPYEVIRQRREEMAHEARQNRLAGELRRSRKRRAGDRGWAGLGVGPGLGVEKDRRPSHQARQVEGRRLGKGLAVVVGLLMLESGKASDDGTKPYDRLVWHIW
jgi:hypothetical protein